MEINLNKEAESFYSNDIKYELSALIDADSFFYGLLDYGHKLAYSNYALSSDVVPPEILQQSDKIRKTKLGYINNLVTLIPNDSFVQEDLSTILQHTCAIQQIKDYVLRSEHSLKHDLRVCYALPKKTVRQVTDVFDAPMLNHFVTTFIDQINVDQGDALHACKLGSFILVSVVNNGKLALTNVYAAVDAVSSFYFISLAYQKIFMKMSFAPIHLSGLIEEGDELHKLIADYYTYVDFVSEGITLDGVRLDSNGAFYPLYCISNI